MTKKEFNDKLNNVYQEKADEFFTQSAIDELIKSYTDQNGNITPDKMAAFAFIESVMINKAILKSVLESVLEFDD